MPLGPTPPRSLREIPNRRVDTGGGVDSKMATALMKAVEPRMELYPLLKSCQTILKRATGFETGRVEIES